MPVAPEYLHLVYGPGPWYAYLYGRASRDPGKKGRSVGDQLHEGQDLCDTNTWPVVGIFRDVDRSASRHAKKGRDDFDAMIEGIEAGKCRIVVAWEASRYYRDLEVYVRLRNACHAAGVLLCYNGAVYDLSKREDRKATAMDALQAEDEAEAIRDRNLRTQRRLAQKGSPSGRPPFGYVRRYDPTTGDLLDQVPDSRSISVKAMFKRFAAGETSYAIAKWLNGEQGARQESGVEWTQERVTAVLRNPAYIGQRVHQGKVIGKALWDPIVDEEVFYAVQEILNNPERRTQRDTSVKHLLSHIARCGEHEDGEPRVICGKRNGKLTYSCLKYDTAIRADAFEAYIEEAVLDWLKSPEAAAAFDKSEENDQAERARVKLAGLTGQLEEARALAVDFDNQGRPKLSALSLAALENRLMPQIEELKGKLTVPSGVPPKLRRLVGQADADAVWEDLTIPQQRSILREIVNIRLHRAHIRGAHKILPGRIVLTFIGEPGFKSG